MTLSACRLSLCSLQGWGYQDAAVPMQAPQGIFYMAVNVGGQQVRSQEVTPCILSLRLLTRFAHTF